jgi:FkbM family methyltransferase
VTSSLPEFQHTDQRRRPLVAFPRLKASARRAAGPLLDRLDHLEHRLEAIEAAMVRQEELLGRDLSTRVDGLWASKATAIGDRVLVGCRHLDLAFYFPADDRLLMPQFVVNGEYERTTTAHLLAQLPPDGVCLDVGANVGYYTCLMSRICWQGRVVAFEADPEVFELLRDNVAINWCEKVAEPRNHAVADRSGSLTLYRRIGRSGNTSIADVPEGERERFGEPASVPFDVGCVTVDEIAADLERLDVVKIDVEGAEALVLEGMRETVARLDPLIIMEWSPDQALTAGGSARGLAEIVESLGLNANVFELDGSLRPITPTQLEHLTYQNVALRR